MGKNFSCNNLGQRKASDLYETPYSLTKLLLRSESFPTQVLEPAAGGGAIVRVLKDFNHEVTSYDIETNFLNEKGTFDCVITNPPFSLASEFIDKCKRVCRNKFTLLLPLSYLHGKKRYDNIWTEKEFPLASIYVFTRYPMLGDELRHDGCYRTGMMVYAWYVWDRSHVGEPVIRWLDNNSYVLNKRRTK